MFVILNDIFSWLIDNRQWVFSGFGVAIVIFILNYFLRKYYNFSIIQKARSIFGKSSNKATIKDQEKAVEIAQTATSLSGETKNEIEIK